MDWNIRKNGKYLLLLLVFGGGIPHLALWMLQLASGSLAPVEIETYSNFFICQWAPFCLALIAYLRLQKMDTFSLLPTLLSAGITLSFLPRFAQKSVWTLLYTVPLILAMELTAVLKKGEGSRSKVLSGLAADRKLLRSFCFWTLSYIALAILSCEASTYYISVASPFLMLPVPGILLWDVFRRQKVQPPTVFGFFGILAMMPLALYLVTVGPMERFQMYHLMSLGAGFAILVLLLIVYNVDNWRRPIEKEK